MLFQESYLSLPLFILSSSLLCRIEKQKYDEMYGMLVEVWSEDRYQVILNCELCSTLLVYMSKRNLSLVVGPDTLTKIQQANILVVGVGGIGC